jgi:D-xylose 1-dehydrogenase (NADP+, D-xylono-1,5-lactone-forming)
MEPVRWGVLSTARINADAFLAPATKTEEADVIAVASRDAARAEAYAREHGIERAYGSYDELLADSDVEAVYNPLPNSMHVDWTVRALEAGKHVLVEKPFGRRPDEVAHAFDVADSAGLVVMEAFMYRHHPQTHKLRELVENGAIGELRMVLASFHGEMASDDIRMQTELDGGALMDLGCYCIGGARLLAGEPLVVFGQQVLGPSGVDLRFAGLLRFDNEVLAEIDCAFQMPFGTGLEALGSEGSAHVDSPWVCRDPGITLRRGEKIERVEVEDDDRYRLQLENMSEAIRGEAEPLLDRIDALGQARTIAALYRSAESATPQAP